MDFNTMYVNCVLIDPVVLVIRLRIYGALNFVRSNLASNFGQLYLNFCYMDSRMITVIGHYAYLQTGPSANVA